MANASSGAGGGTSKGQASTLSTFVADDPHAMASLINGSGLHPHGFNASHANSHAILHKTRTRPIAIGQSNWPVELDLEELFFHLRAKGNEIGQHSSRDRTPVDHASGPKWSGGPSPGNLDVGSFGVKG